MDVTKATNEELYKMFRNLLKAQENISNDLRIVNIEIEKREKEEKSKAPVEDATIES